ncbi:sigma-70 family RNA polymerase sigma factor [Herbaspirillum lusitanum]|uniref:Sigma-70 family RNA polymerase sigma factor n=1 Tax=Herbaspirillum lusitanum TaxID=213312 RepID=A0ABW9AE65_9BURK
MPIAPDTFDYDAALRACARGERGALQGLYQQESRYLLGVALRIVRQRQLAEDVLHDAFLSIWSGAGGFDAGKGAGRGWIYSIVRNKALNAIRSREREVAADEDTVEAVLHENAAHDAAEAFELNASLGKLNDCLAHLDASKRASILFAYVDGCSHSEIAQRLKAPLGSVKAWIKRGLGALRECMA